jgi:phosphatidylserine/phosphatidylglycerophosphate/cardiolipin synthase-like enzyme
MHHKFVVIDFGTPDARVYAGSFNFSTAADTSNGENLLMIKDPAVATSYAIEALRIFDHYEFRLLQQNAATARKQLSLQRPPAPGSADKPWWDRYYTDPRRARDRVFFA